MIRVAVIGSTGQLGTDLVRVLRQSGDYQAFPLSHSDIECAEPERVRQVLGALCPDVVVNCAAFVRVDDCEDRPEEAYRVNALGARYVAEACAALGAACVYVSTDYVFGGEKQTPYLEEDSPNPLSVYGASKLAGEQLVRISLDRHYVVRCSGLFGIAGASGKGGNFITTMLRLAREGRDIQVVDDQRFSPTSTEALAEKIAWLITTGEFGTWHITCQGECTWYEFAEAAFQLTGLHPKLSPITAAEFGLRAKRPAYSVLGHGRLQQARADNLPHWRDSLEQYLRAKRET
ncbi:MAG TPA: dTDP-4-dehydrorhamnose reductase [Candidatus Tectomicrobia bacterium]